MTTTKIDVRFPGGLLMKVSPGARFQMFVDGDAGEDEKVVEYHVGDPSVCFVVRRSVIPAQSFFGVQLALQLRDVEDEEDGVVKVVLKEHSPLLFAFAFDYMNQVAFRPSTAVLRTTGLSVDEATQMAALE